MKKLLVFVLIAAACGAGLSAQAAAESSEDTLTYVNVSVYKVYDNKDAYIVLYGKSNNTTAQVVIPKKWAGERPRRLEIRNMINPTKQPYMSVWFRGGAFERITLTLPRNRQNAVWGAAPWADVGDLDKTSITVEF
jgi:hypothetical protein